MKFLKTKSAIFVAVLVIIGVGIFLRAYHFSDWLHFELDQARDAKFISMAVKDGAENLPVLGPKAAGTYLRLGPAFYYFEYLSAKLFGNTPPAHAASVLIFSIASLPLFYFFCRRYFSVLISLGLLALFSVSLFMVLYSRFSWNPNLLPFFVLLCFYALLRAASAGEKYKRVWFLIAMTAMTICTQLHFIALFIIPAIAIIFLAVKRPSLGTKTWIGALAIVLTLYSPVIINDIKTGGENFKEFKKALFEKSGNEKRSIFEKAFQNIRENSLGYYLVVTGDDQAELPIIDLEGDVRIKTCDKFCRENLPRGILAFVFFGLGTFFLLANIFREREQERKNFLILCTLWLGVSFAFFLPVAYDMYPRFFLLASPLAVIFMGFIFEKVRPQKNKTRLSIFGLFLTALILVNLYGVWRRFQEFKKAPFEEFAIQNDKILRERARVTLEQQLMITDYIESKYRENEYPIYLQSEPFYKRAFEYHMKQRDIPYDGLKKSTVYKQGNHFIIYRTLSSDVQSNLEKYAGSYNITGKKQFGTLTIYQLIPKPEAVTALRQDFAKKEDSSGSSSNIPQRHTWKEFFSKGAESVEEKDVTGDEFESDQGDEDF